MRIEPEMNRVAAIVQNMQKRNRMVTQATGDSSVAREHARYLEDIPGTIRDFCEESDDASTLLEIVNTGMLFHYGQQLPPEYNQKGGRLLTGIERYFAKQRVIVRPLVPPLASEGEGRVNEDVRDTYFSTLENMRRAGAVLSAYPNIQRFLDKLGATVRQEPLRDGQAFVVVPSTEVADHANYMGFSQMVSAFITDVRSRRTYFGHANWSIPDRTVAHLRELSAARIPGVPDPLTARFSGISLEMLIAESDETRFIDNALRFMAAIPEKNYLWGCILQSTFLNACSAVLEKDSGLVQNFTLARNIAAFQRYLAEGFVLPTLTGVRNNRFDQAVGSAMRQWDVKTLHQAGAAFLTVLYRSYGDDSVFDRKQVSPLVSYITEKLGTGDIFYGRECMRTLTANRTQIEADVQRRFSKCIQAHGVAFVLLETIDSTNFDEEHAQVCLGDLPRQTNLLTDLSSENLQAAIREIVKYSAKKEEVAFAEDSLLASLGLQCVVITQVKPGVRSFTLVRRSNGYMFTQGYIMADGSVELVFPDKEEYRELRTLVTTIALYMNDKVLQDMPEETQEAEVKKDSSRSQEGMTAAKAHEALRSYFNIDDNG